MKWIERPNGDWVCGEYWIKTEYAFGLDSLRNEVVRSITSLRRGGGTVSVFGHNRLRECTVVVSGEEFTVDSCKRLAEADSKGPPLFDLVWEKLEYIPDRIAFEQEMKELGLLYFPRIDYPHREFLLKKARLAVEQEVENFSVDNILREAKKEIPIEGRLAFIIESWIIFRELKLKKAGESLKVRLDAIKHQQQRLSERFAATPVPATPADMARWSDRGQDRSTEGLIKILTVSQDILVMISKPENAKFSTLLAWAEKIRDKLELKGKFGTLPFLRYALPPDWPHERKELAKARLDVLYQSEANWERTKIEKMVENSKKVLEREQKGEKLKGKDKWGFRLGTGASAIDAAITKELKSLVQIAKDAGQKPQRTASHLNVLLKRKLVKKVGEKFRIRKMPQNKGE